MTTPITGDTWGDVIEPVREFLLQEATSTFAILLPKLDAARGELLAAIEGVTDSQGAFRPGGGAGEEAWGIAEVLRHLASIEVIMADRIRLLGLGLPVEVTTTYPGYMEGVESRSLPELRSVLDQSYAQLLAAIASIEGHERLDTLEPHRRFGELNCRAWLVMHGLHIQDHARQIGRLKALPGYPDF